ncbi:hypothetical protein [Apibacter adventoris]|uniref:Uncharacterized protein n=1 Tax=Apibacter adventoris TaxID=1679466 RepID=A0A2S8A847_9FLAO|nr:hypothetical protein [Apibacter adventoris]PQL90744.1 hypothetical protein C4S77_09815 [Apibacter adventoris]
MTNFEFSLIDELDCIEKQEDKLKRSSWDDEKDNIPDYHKIELYDYNKTHEENFKSGSDKKYILIAVEGNKHFTVTNSEFIFPTPQSKCLVDISKVEEFSNLEFIPMDYDTIFGTRFTTFIKYNSNFFLCDERIIFEALLIKLKSFDYKPFYWSKEMIFKEAGIKKDRATKIIERFKELGILSTEIKKSIINSRPQQITYYTLHPEKILELLPKIFEGRDNLKSIENELNTYLKPILKKSAYNTLL